MTLDSGVVVDTWHDPSAPVAERVRDLMARMTITEKIAQLYGVWVGMDASGAVAPHQNDVAAPPVDWTTLIKDGIGQLTRPFGTAPVEPAVGAEGVAHSQREIVAAGRFGIPAMVHEEILTGLAAWQATVYPSPNHTPAAGRSGLTLKPLPLPTRPAAVRPQPSGSATVLSGWPGITHATISSERPPLEMRTRSPPRPIGSRA